VAGFGWGLEQEISRVRFPASGGQSITTCSGALRGTAVAAGLATLALVGGIFPAASPATAAGLTSLTITGHGWGHGRGMGQYGAYGYALAGWNYSQILAHFYGGTVASSVNPDEVIKVQLTEFDNGASRTPGPGSDTTVSEYGTTRYYPGTIQVIGTQVFDLVELDQYVAGVVPAESPASWGASSLGINALEAQAVAARSYALAELASRGSVCDSDECQVYDGDPNVAGSPTNSPYTTYSNQAVATTAGKVLLCQASACGAPGSVALTEFSSSTGGYTAGGAFPAVPDAGDATPSNPNHTWTVNVSAAEVEAAYPAVGTLTGVTVDTRNGFGDLGGRVLTLTVSGTAGSVTDTGTDFAAALGLNSNWFTFGADPGAPNAPVPPAPAAATPVVSGGDDGYWIVGSDGSIFDFGAAPDLGSMAGQTLNAPIVAMAPTAEQEGYWLVGGDGGVFSFGDAAFHGSTGGMTLNAPVLGIAGTPDGGGYWLVAGDGGVFNFGDAGFYGSTGNLVLNQPIVAMAATPDGRGYWLVAADGGVFNFGDAGFYGSTGGLHLNQPIVGVVPTADGRGYTLVARDGGVFAFGDAPFLGSLPGIGVSDDITGVATTADGGGYMEVAADGAVYTFGDAPFEGSVASIAPGWNGTAFGIFAHKGA
jgi:SpoIID/LytB domain protein